MKIILLTFVSLLLPCALQGQQPNVTVSSSRGAGNSLSLSAEITGYGYFTVMVDYTKLVNTAPRPGDTVELNGSAANFITLEPLNPSAPVEAEYEYNWLQGRIDPPAEEGFAYRLPFAAEVSSIPEPFLGNRPMGRNIMSRTVWEFPLPEGTPVLAVRNGIVIHTDFNIDDNVPAVISSRGNTVVVQHPDGTVAEYTCLSSGSLRVKEGDEVMQGTVIAVAGTTESGHAARLGIYYFVSHNDPLFGGIAKKKYFNPVFMTTDGERHPEAGVQITAADIKSVPAAKIAGDSAGNGCKRNFWQRLFGCKK